MSGRLQGVPSCHPRCLLDGRTWSKLENVNQMKSKHTIHDLIKNTLFVTQNTLFVNQMTKKNSILRHLWWRLKNQQTCLENMILGQLKMGEHEAKCEFHCGTMNFMEIQDALNDLAMQCFKIISRCCFTCFYSNIGMKMYDIQITFLN